MFRRTTGALQPRFPPIKRLSPKAHWLGVLLHPPCRAALAGGGASLPSAWSMAPPCLRPHFSFSCDGSCLLAELGQAWESPPPQPVWRLRQKHFPQWNVCLPLDGTPRQFSRICYDRTGVVGVHVRSHQTHSSHPCQAITQGNEVQDAGCQAACQLPTLPDILLPSCGRSRGLPSRGDMSPPLYGPSCGSAVQKPSGVVCRAY